MSLSMVLMVLRKDRVSDQSARIQGGCVDGSHMMGGSVQRWICMYGRDVAVDLNKVRGTALRVWTRCAGRHSSMEQLVRG